jgi:hypothetical protein
VRLGIVIFLTIVHLSVEGQYSVFPGGYGLRGMFGFAVPSANSQKHLIESHARGLEFNYRYNFSGVKEWEKYFKYPYSGFALNYIFLGGSKIGRAYSLMPYIGLPLKKNSFVDVHIRLATGISYVSRKFDLEFNRSNTLIGSNLNLLNDVMLQANWKIDKKLHLLTGISLSYYSNGAFTEPATSFCLLAVNTGLTINTGRPVAVNHYSFPILDKGWKFIAWSGIWRKEAISFLSKKYTAAVLGLNALRRYSIKGSYGGGIDVFYDQTLTVRSEGSSNVRLGILLAYELMLGRMSIPLQQGVYAINPIKRDGFLYQRIGWKYHFNRSLAAQISLKFHNLTNDHAEVGLVYQFRP